MLTMNNYDMSGKLGNNSLPVIIVPLVEQMKVQSEQLQSKLTGNLDIKEKFSSINSRILTMELFIYLPFLVIWNE